MVKKLALGIALFFASTATAQTQDVMLESNLPAAYLVGYVYAPHDGDCLNSIRENSYFYRLEGYSSVHVSIEKDSVFCIESRGYVRHPHEGPDQYFHGPYRATAECTFFDLHYLGDINSTDCKAATIDMNVKNEDRWGFDVKLFYPDANNQCTLSNYPSKEELTRIPEHEEKVVSLAYDHNVNNPNVCLYLETYNNPTNLYRKTHGPFLKMGGLIVIHNTKEVEQRR